jgi:hypothetical protein
MSQKREKNTGAKGCTSIPGKKQTSTCNFMCSTSMSSAITSRLNPKTQKKSESDKPSNINIYKQQKISLYIIPIPSNHSSPNLAPPQSHKPRVRTQCTSPGINLYSAFSETVSAHNTTRPVILHPSVLTAKCSPIWKQAPITNYFATRCMATPASVVQPISPSLLVKSKSIRRALLRYHPPKKVANRITRYSSSLPSYDLFESWGRSLEVIDTSTTFRVFLQNPNGLSIHHNNHLLIQDLQTCYKYGAGDLCFPETNTNWNQEGQVRALQQLFRNVWHSSVIQPFQTPDPFLSTYQPGGGL